MTRRLLLTAALAAGGCMGPTETTNKVPPATSKPAEATPAEPAKDAPKGPELMPKPKEPTRVPG